MAKHKLQRGQLLVQSIRTADILISPLEAQMCAACRAESFINTEKEEDPTTHEVKYTTSVGNIEDAGGRSLLMNASPQMAQDVRAAFAAVPRVKPTWTERHLKIMVVGESGLGKYVPLYFCMP